MTQARESDGFNGNTHYDELGLIELLSIGLSGTSIKSLVSDMLCSCPNIFVIINVVSYITFRMYQLSVYVGGLGMCMHMMGCTRFCVCAYGNSIQFGMPFFNTIYPDF